MKLYWWICYFIFIEILLMPMPIFCETIGINDSFVTKDEPKSKLYMNLVSNQVRSAVNYLKAPPEVQQQYDELNDLIKLIDENQKQLDEDFDDSPSIKVVRNDQAVQKRGSSNRYKMRKMDSLKDMNRKYQPNMGCSLKSDKQDVNEETVDVTDMIEDIMKLIASVKLHAKDLVVDLDKLEKHVLMDDSDIENTPNISSLKNDGENREKIPNFYFKPPHRCAEGILKAWKDQIENSKRILDIAVAQALHSQNILEAQLLNNRLHKSPFHSRNNCYSSNKYNHWGKFDGKSDSKLTANNASKIEDLTSSYTNDVNSNEAKKFLMNNKPSVASSGDLLTSDANSFASKLFNIKKNHLNY